MMSLEALGGLLAVIVVLVLGALLRQALNKTNALQQQFWEFREHVALNFVHQDSFKDAVAGLDTKLDLIFKKLDRKQDKP